MGHMCRTSKRDMVVEKNMRWEEMECINAFAFCRKYFAVLDS